MDMVAQKVEGSIHHFLPEALEKQGKIGTWCTSKGEFTPYTHQNSRPNLP